MVKNVTERLALVKRNLQEVIGEEDLLKLLQGTKTPSAYLGTAITGKPHIGYFVWGVKMLDLLKAGFTIKVLLADVHGALDNTPWDLLEKRYHYYEKVIGGMFETLGADMKNVQFIKGSSFQLKKEYVLDLLKLATNVTVHDATKAASDVVKLGDSPKLAGIIYPLMQALDEEYLGVDVQYGGIDQRKILVFARESLPKLGYKPRVEIMTPLIPGLQGAGAKMSASVAHSKIDLLDDEKTVKEKLDKAYCPAGEIEGNGVLAFLNYVVMAQKEPDKKKFIVSRPAKFGGDLMYDTYADIETDFVAKKLHPLDLKNAVATEINALLAPIRKKMASQQKLVSEAYPNI
ncbi:tyrosine--tRNA ligase [Candidatus Woesearchaeota archaeon]|nr:tyrosine--tRNA ligase [Candidatus Woesearchaeota archaeon]